MDPRRKLALTGQGCIQLSPQTPVESFDIPLMAPLWSLVGYRPFLNGQWIGWSRLQGIAIDEGRSPMPWYPPAQTNALDQVCAWSSQLLEDKYCIRDLRKSGRLLICIAVFSRQPSPRTQPLPLSQGDFDLFGSIGLNLSLLFLFHRGARSTSKESKSNHVFQACPPVGPAALPGSRDHPRRVHVPSSW